MTPRALPRLILVTDPAYDGEAILRVVDACAAALPPGALAVQLRDKTREPVALRHFASRLRLVTRRHGAWLIVNRHAEIARDVGAEGVHLGGDAMRVADARRICGEGTFLSIAAHSDAAVRLGAADGADAALVSPIFASPGKGAGRGLDAIRSACAASPPGFPIYALGGIGKENAAECRAAGAFGVAVIRALLRANDPGFEARAVYEAMTSC